MDHECWFTYKASTLLVHAFLHVYTYYILFSELKDKLLHIDGPALVMKKMQHKSTDRAMAIVPNSKGWLTQQLAKDLVQKSLLQEPAFIEFTAMILVRVAECLPPMYSPCSHSTTTDSVSSLLSLRFDDTVRRKWTQCITPHAPNYTSIVYNNLLQHLLDDIVPEIKNLWRSTNEKTMSSSADTPEQTELTKEEKSVLHYTAGFVLRKLKNKYTRIHQNNASQLFLDVLKGWSTPTEGYDFGEESQLADEVTAWTVAQDRGSLIHCAPRFYNFIKCVELRVRIEVNSQKLPVYAGKNIVPIVHERIRTCTAVREAFHNLILHDLSNDQLCEALLDDILVTWIMLKARQAVKKYIFDTKLATPGVASRMGAPALRKTLDKI